LSGTMTSAATCQLTATPPRAQSTSRLRVSFLSRSIADARGVHTPSQRRTVRPATPRNAAAPVRVRPLPITANALE
jgi:hypothetical protein